MAASRIFVRAAVLSASLVAPVASQSPALDAAPSRYASYNGARVHYKNFGTGSSAVIFVHGWAGALGVWSAQLPAVEEKTRAIFVDLPGSGASDSPDVAYTMDHFAGSLDAVMRDAGVERAVLVGHSMGTPVVRQFYRKFPSKVIGLVAVDGALRSFLADTAQLSRFLGQFEGPGYAKNVSAMFDGMLATMTDSVMRTSVKRMATSTPQRVAASSMRGMMDPSIWGDDPINVPMLAVMAPNAGWNADYVAYVKRLAPGIRFEVMPKSGHFVMLERPAEFNALLLEFLKAQRLVP